MVITLKMFVRIMRNKLEGLKVQDARRKHYSAQVGHAWAQGSGFRVWGVGLSPTPGLPGEQAPAARVQRAGVQRVG